MKPFSKYILLLIFCFTTGTFAQLPTCSQAGCPTGGVWGEWKNVGSGLCDLDCGGCGTLLQARECISAPNCNCTGTSTRYTGCNFNACKYPAQKTCCSPYLPMVLNGTQICGPVPKTIDSSACCPQSSLFSEWSGWISQNGGWARTRRCLAASIGCPCAATDLTQTSTACPCPQPASAMEDCAIPTLPGVPIYARSLSIDDATCSAVFVMIGEAQRPTMPYCKALSTGYPNAMGYQGALFLMKETVSQSCFADTVFDCLGGTISNRGNASFSCNLTTLKWTYDFSGKDVDSVVQAYWNLTAA